jgi:hypothetical protein
MRPALIPTLSAVFALWIAEPTPSSGAALEPVIPAGRVTERRDSVEAARKERWKTERRDLRILELCLKSPCVLVASAVYYQSEEAGTVIGLELLEILKSDEPFAAPLPDRRTWNLWIPRSADMATETVFGNPRRFLVFARSAPIDLFPSSLLPRVKFVLADSRFGTLPAEAEWVQAARRACSRITKENLARQR